MNKNIAKGLILFSILLGYSSLSFGAVMTDYCQVPPFIGTGGEPNILMVNDVSGSMSWSAYGTSDSSFAPPDSSYDASKGYEGYFEPAKYYKPVDPSSCSIADTSTCTACDPSISNCLYIETAPPTGGVCVQTCINHSCVRRQSFCAMGNLYGGGRGNFGCDTSGNRPYGCCTEISSTGDCNLSTGNYLNYHNMRRIDILRWALTGGRPATCSGSFGSDRCDPELWDQSGNTASGKIGTVCNDSLDVDGDGTADGGCILQVDNGTEVAARWSRVYDGLATQFKSLLVKPRLGVMTYDTSGVNTNKVFLGDFLASNVNSADFPYMNLITNINSQNPGGGTPTGPAMWDALNYYAMNAPQYGGFPAQSGSGDRWKNPLYVCDGGGGNNCVLNTCARNYVLLMSDGDWNTPSNDIGSNPRCTATASSQSSDPVVPAYCMHNGFTNAMGTASDTSDDVSTKVSGVYTIGLFMGSASCGIKAMENVAMYGSFENSAKTWPDSLTGFPGTSTCSCTDGTSSGSLCAALPASSTDWDLNGDGMPDAFFSADDALNIKQDIMNAVQDILSHATSGTAASVLASGEGSGANLVQATYYPRRRFYDTSISWTGGLQNLWYYIDPTFNYSSIREDDGDKILNLDTVSDSTHKDYTTQFYFDTTEQKAKARIYNSLSSGVTGTLVATIDFEELGNLWESGKLLWNRDATDRTIYSPLDTSQTLTSSANKFSASSPDNTAVLRPLLNTDNGTDSAINNQLAANIINYVRGVDVANYIYTAGGTTVTEIYRPRTVKIDLNNNGNATDTSVVVSGVTMNETVAKVWKLGDIINSTPRIASWAPLGDYVNKYSDATYLSFFSSPTYTNRGMVYVGANDGMLHAFKLGTLQYKWSGQNTTREIAKLGGTDLGKEMWAFIPKNVLPYLKYLKETDYCHIHTVDLTPYLVDASINSPSGCAGDYWQCAKSSTSWRTILIGGMKLGGACRDTASTCTDCVKTPVSGNGYSAYFALDVTDENNPKFLWEFSNAELGFSTSGPAVVRIGSRTAGVTSSSLDSGTNGRWFVVFGSGPTGPIDVASQKFQGRSDQNLKLFVLDLKTGSLVRTIDTGVQYAFAGSMLGSTFDNTLDYQDDAVYIPYVKRTGSSSHYTWTDGGVLRLLTNQDLTGNNVSGGSGGTTALNPDNWQVSTVMDGIGPVTSSVAHLHNKTTGELWLFFGTGRYYFRSSAGTDDASSQRNLFGIVEPCFNNNAYVSGCVDSRSITDLGPAVDLTTTTGSTNSSGWYVNLEGQGARTFDENGNGTTTDDVLRNYNSERVITDPAAQTSGVVYFTTYEPYNDLCAIGGKTFIWALKYNTGGSASSLVSGTALIQVSTGSIEQIKLSTAFSDKGNRRSGAIEGVPPTAQGLSLMQAPAPVQKVFHKRER